MTTPEPDYLGTNPVSPARGKTDLHIPGAGTMAMVLLIASLSMLFAASMMVYFVFRAKVPQSLWRPSGFDHLPGTLWISTAILMACSVTIHMALAAVRKDRQQKMMAGLIATLILGLVFLLAQSWNWYELWTAISADQHRGKFMTTFYLLTGLHAAHVFGGLIPLAVVLVRANRQVYSRNFHPGVRYCAIYWHFLDAAWLFIFVSLLLGT
jgi:cytochrome c oxidase subunit 3